MPRSATSMGGCWALHYVRIDFWVSQKVSNVKGILSECFLGCLLLAVCPRSVLFSRGSLSNKFTLLSPWAYDRRDTSYWDALKASFPFSRWELNGASPFKNYAIISSNFTVALQITLQVFQSFLFCSFSKFSLINLTRSSQK
jgi:hypothetical protein